MEADQKFLSRFDGYFDAINAALDKPLCTRVPVIEEIGRHSLLGAGKRLRPLLFVLSAELCGYRGAEIYHFSTIFEYIHTASLLHDDVLDNAETRRRKPAARHIWGNAVAVLGGDYLFARASTVALECDKPELMKVLSRATARMVEGQFLELEHTHDWHVRKDRYMEIIISKTAELMAAACVCGGILAGAGPEAIRGLSDFGLNLGIAFQLMDDVLDYSSCEEEFGKPVGKDLREGKITLPLIYALQGMSEQEIDRISEPFRNQRAGEDAYRDVINRVRSRGFLDAIRAEARVFADLAERFLGIFPDASSRERLLSLNSYLLRRNF
ncbi:MAG: polyprenyl synthetase family protein [Deltaproteobacteria bacterium]|nr:polyprenyl synthetase family protein [Deltaproteobacteria bacterium]